MLRQWAVAGFAVHMCMHSAGVSSGDIRMALFAGLVTGELHWMRGDFVHGCSTIVTIFPKGCWNYVVAHDQKYKEGDYK